VHPLSRVCMNNTGFLSQQSIFDQAVKHLFSQGRAALLPQRGGAYRGNCGTCPVGRDKVKCGVWEVRSDQAASGC
jgi:hypothetical protein